MNNVSFSVCIPNYNYAAFLGMTIQSVLDQTYPAYEIIIADNASTDNSVEVIKSFKDSRIRLIKNEINIGFGPNLDIATEQAKGDFIILLSSDDIMKPNALSVYAKILMSYEQGNENLVLFSAFDLINENNHIFLSKNAIPSHIDKALNTGLIEGNRKNGLSIIKGNDALKITLRTTLSSVGQFCTTCYSKTLYDRVKGYRSQTTIIPDATFMHKICFLNPILIYTEENIFQYRIHQSSNYTNLQKMKNIKLLTDKYVLTQLYTSSDLNAIGLSTIEIKKAFIQHYCINVPFFSLLKGKGAKTYHHLFFGLASYPILSLQHFKFYITLFGLPFLPIFKFLNFIFNKQSK